MLLVLGKERLVWLGGQWIPQPLRLRAWPGCCLLRKSLDAELGANGVFGWAGSSASENSAGGSAWSGSRTRTGLKIIPKRERRANCYRVCVISTHTWQLHSLLLFNIILSQYCPTWGFPEGPVFKTLHFQCKEHRFDPGSCSQKVKIKYIYIAQLGYYNLEGKFFYAEHFLSVTICARNTITGSIFHRRKWRQQEMSKQLIQEDAV